mgnify:CR=1 FL=1
MVCHFFGARQFKMSSCYEYKAFACEAPRLRSVGRAYILTMANSTRLTESRLSTLRQLCRTTVVQYNHKARSGCRKPECTQKSNFDIVHAYQAACRHAEAKGGGPVLFLEDDAIVRLDVTQEEFDLVDEFVRTRGFDVYTFGSIGVVPPWGNSGDHYSMLMLWHAQATIWSHETRRKLIGADVSTIPHIDAHFLSSLKLKFKFRRPLIVQTFPNSVNSALWCLHCQDDALGRLEKWGAGVWSKWYRDSLKLDEYVLPGWDILNLLTHVSFGVVTLLLCIVTGIVVALALRFFARCAKPDKK